MNENEIADKLEQDINGMDEAMEHGITHQAHLMYTLNNIEEKLGVVAFRSRSSGREGIAEVEAEELTRLVDAWFEGLEALNICFKDIDCCLGFQKSIAAFLLNKSVPLRTDNE